MRMGRRTLSHALLISIIAQIKYECNFLYKILKLIFILLGYCKAEPPTIIGGYVNHIRKFINLRANASVQLN